MKSSIFSIVFLMLTCISQLFSIGYNPATGSDYLVITHNELYDETGWCSQLYNLLGGLGHKVGFSTISDGTTPEDIRSYILDAYETGVHLKYILLVGHCNNSASSTMWGGKPNSIACADSNNYLPFKHDPTMNYTSTGYESRPTDDYYVRNIIWRRGEEYYISKYGIMKIGRVPAISIGEIENWVSKLEQYYSSLNQFGDWRNSFLLLNHNIDHPWGGYKKICDHHTEKIELMSDDYSYSVERLNSFEIDTLNKYEYSSDRTEAFVDKVNNGVSFINCYGTAAGAHNIVGYYTQESYLDPKPSETLTNSGMYPVLFGLCCEIGLVGWNYTPKPKIMPMRELMFGENSGIIAAFAPTSDTDALANLQYGYSIYDKIFNHNMRELGEIISQTKKDFIHGPFWSKWMLYTYVYFGDPSMPLALYQYKSISSLPFSDIGSTVGQPNNWNVQGLDGSDVAYLLELDHAATLDVTLCSPNTDYDTMLEIFNADGTRTGKYDDDDDNGYGCDYNYLASSLWDVYLAAGEYYIVVDGFYDEGNYELNVTYSPDYSIPSLPYTHQGSTVGKTNDWDVRHNWPGDDGADVAYRLILNHSAALDVTLCSPNTDYDTKLEIFNADGTSTGHYNDDDDYCNAGPMWDYNSSLWDRHLSAGEYYIVVDGWYGETGNYGLQVEYASDYVISSLPYTHNGSNVGKINDWRLQGWGGDGADVAYYINLATSSTLDVTLCNANTDYDTKLEIFNANGTSTGWYNDDDDDCDEDDLFSSLWGSSLSAGKYYIVVDGYAGETGNYTINVSGTGGLAKTVTLAKKSDKDKGKSNRRQNSLANILKEFEKELKKSEKSFNGQLKVYPEMIRAEDFVYQLEKTVNGGKPVQKEVAHISPPDDWDETYAYEMEKLRKKKVDSIPKSLRLYPAYPYPFNPIATIRYDLPDETKVNISIFSINGQLVNTLVSEVKPAGSYTLQWNSTNTSGQPVASGLYFCRLTTPNKILNRKLMLLK